MQIFRFAEPTALRHREGNSYNRSEKNLHPSVCLGWIAGDPARFRQFEWRNAFQPCIAERGSERRNASPLKLITMTGRAS
jgi:hypothetical protein